MCVIAFSGDSLAVIVPKLRGHWLQWLQLIDPRAQLIQGWPSSQSSDGTLGLIFRGWTLGGCTVFVVPLTGAQSSSAEVSGVVLLFPGLVGCFLQLFQLFIGKPNTFPWRASGGRNWCLLLEIKRTPNACFSDAPLRQKQRSAQILREGLSDRWKHLVPHVSLLFGIKGLDSTHHFLLCKHQRWRRWLFKLFVCRLVSHFLWVSEGKDRGLCRSDLPASSLGWGCGFPARVYWMKSLSKSEWAPKG